MTQQLKTPRSQEDKQAIADMSIMFFKTGLKQGEQKAYEKFKALLNSKRLKRIVKKGNNQHTKSEILLTNRLLSALRMDLDELINNE